MPAVPVVQLAINGLQPLKTPPSDDGDVADALPDPDVVPADQANV